jgi:predicted porin
MNKTIFTGCILLTSLSGVAHAQSTVTLYGLIDTSLRFTTNNSSASGAANSIALTSGAIQGSRWGLKGSEDLGNGYKAVFDLENGFVLNNGTIDQQGQLFGRQAWVGIKTPDFGSVLAGRMYGIPFGTLSDFDPLGIGNYLENEYISRIVGVRYDNTVDYSISRGPVSLELQYSFGGQAGSTVPGSTTSGGITYLRDGLEVAAVGQQSRDAQEHKLLIFGGGSQLRLGPVTLYGMYVNARRDAGFSPSSTIGLPLANTSLIGNSNTILGTATQTAQRIDSYLSLAVGYQATPALNIKIGFFQDNVAHVVEDQSGRIRTTLLNADYALSKRTDIYAEVDRNWLSGASVTDPNNPPLTFAGKSTRTGIGLGLRTRF